MAPENGFIISPDKAENALEKIESDLDCRVAAGNEERRTKSKASASGFRSTATSVLLFLPIFIAIRHARPTGTILYQGVLLGFIISLAQFSVECRRVRQVGEAAKDALLTFLLIYSFVFTVPTTVDRAYSVRILTRLDQSPNGLTHDEIKDIFVHGFLTEGGVDKRLIEQASTGSIREHNGRYSVTPMGRFLSATFRVTQVIFSCREKP